MKQVYTIEDLRGASEDAENIFSREEKPARLAVIGNPVEHSKSPQLHQPALDALGINATYIRVSLTAEEFDEGVSRLQELGFIGTNVTVPHKERALAWAKKPDSFSGKVGVANTILFREGSCFTTDPVGLESAVREKFAYAFDGEKVLILGAGGGAGAAVAEYLQEFAYEACFLYNRTEAKLDEWKERKHASGKLQIFGNGNFPASEEYDLIINATSLGLKETDSSPFPSELLQEHHLVYDMTYGVENALKTATLEAGARYEGGLSMLRHQGAEAFKLWFPEETKGKDVISLMGLQ